MNTELLSGYTRVPIVPLERLLQCVPFVHERVRRRERAESGRQRRQQSLACDNAAGPHRGTLQHLSELAHIAWPLSFLEQHSCVVVESQCWAKSCEKMFSDQT